VAVQSAKKYKFNTLAEYLDDVKMRTDEHMWDNYDPPNVTSYKGHPDYDGDVAAWDKNHKKAYADMLDTDETIYRSLKSSYGPNGTYDPVKYEIPKGHQGQFDLWQQEQNAFSPQAKQEMKAFKTNVQDLHDSYIGDGTKADWASWIANNRSSDNGAMGIQRIISGEF